MFKLKKMNKIKKCPICNSSKIKFNEEDEIKCDNCCYTHSNKKKAHFVEFGEIK